jgi:hypothetical protein
MRAASIFLYVAGLTFLLIDGVYVTWSLLLARFEVIGAIAIGLSGVMCIALAFYLSVLLRGLDGRVLPEDRLDAEIDDGDSEMGFFSPWSWWPILLAGGTALVFLGLAISFWISLIGAPLLIVSLIGWYYEYYRGYFSR